MNNFSLQIPVVTLPNMHKTAVLLTNLGSPDAPTSKALKPYLTEFLMDEKVMDISYWKSLLLVKGIIVPFRAKKSAAKYRTIWTQEGSPLIACTKKQTELLGQKTNFPVYYSMR